MSLGRSTLKLADIVQGQLISFSNHIVRQDPQVECGQLGMITKVNPSEETFKILHVNTMQEHPGAYAVQLPVEEDVFGGFDDRTYQRENRDSMSLLVARELSGSLDLIEESLKKDLLETQAALQRFRDLRARL